MSTWVKIKETQLKWLDNPHKVDTESYRKYEQAKDSKSVGEAREKGASAWDLQEWFKKGKLKVVEEEMLLQVVVVTILSTVD